MTNNGEMRDEKPGLVSSAISLGFRTFGVPRFKKKLALRACRERFVATCPVEALTTLPDGVRTLVPTLCSICSLTDQPHGNAEIPEVSTRETQVGNSIRCIFLQVHGGLCNRLRSLVSGICWAEDLSCRLVVSWPYDNQVTYCRFEDLLDPGSLPSYVTVIPCQLGAVTACRSESEMGSRVASASRNGDSSLRLLSSDQFHESDQERWVGHLRALRPTREILARVSDVLEPAPGPRIGVLVRRHGHEVTTEESPLSEFLQPMRKEDPHTVFVVASDDDDAQACLENEFPGRCLFPARFRERDFHRSREGMKEVLVNFICLARCPRILAAYWSSFGYVAADYGGAQLVEIRRPHPVTDGADPGVLCR
jgi:hypothetical protein